MPIGQTDKKLPPFLYRGDGDRDNRRKLKSTIQHQQYQTNLINGGNGREIFDTPLKELINKHVNFAIGWKTTNFLSFSEEEATAYRYGAQNPDLTSEEIENNYIEYPGNDDKWIFAILTFETEKVRWNILQPGIYEGFYTPSLFLFEKDTDKYRIILLDVKTILAKQPKFEIAYKNARQDNEWLLLPATTTTFKPGLHEYSAILDGTCITAKKIIEFSNSFSGVFFD